MHQIAVIEASRYRFDWGEVIGNEKFYACSEPQLDILSSPAKYTFGIAGTQSGKTAILPLWLFLKLTKFRNDSPTKFWRALVVSPSSNTFDGSQLKRHILEVFNDTVFHGEWLEQKKTYIGTNFEIVVRTAENDYQRLSGGAFNVVALDEAFQMSDPEIWEEAKRRLSATHGDILVITTPNVNNWVYECYQQWEQGNPLYYFRQWSTSENPVRTPEQHKVFLDEQLKTLGQARFDRMYRGQFSALSGLVYDCFSQQDSPNWPVIKTLDKLPSPAVRAFGGLDYGYNDPTSFHIFIHCENDLVYCVDELYETKLEVDFLGVKIKQMIEKWSIKYSSQYGNLLGGGFFEGIYSDSSRPEVSSLIRRFGIPIKPHTVHNIEAGIAITDSLLRTKRVKIFDCCTNLVREGKQYAYNSKGRPIGLDHALDDMRYALSSYYRGQKITLLPDEAIYQPLTTDEEAQTAIRLGQARSKEDLDREIAKQEAERIQKHIEWMLTCESE